MADFEEEEPYTGAVIDDAPLKGEDDADTLFPATIFDQDTLSNVHNRRQRKSDEEAAEQQAEDQRNYLRVQRRRALLDRVLQFITRHHLLPQKWLHVNAEAGERYPAFVCTIRDNYWRWGTSFVSAMSFVATFIWLVSWCLGAPSTVMHDGTNVINLWKPSSTYEYDLSSEQISAWLTEHKAETTVIRPRDMRAEYFSAHVYPAGERRNITFPWLYDALDQACKHGAKDKNDVCTCMPAVEIGILTNIVLVGGTVMINPHVTSQSDELWPAGYDDGTKASQPLAVMVEYMHQSGKKDRREERLHNGMCLMRSLDLVGKLSG